MNTLEMVADSAKELAGKAADKAKSAARIAKLSMEINAEKDTIKKAYLEIGKLYYEMNRDNPDGFFAQLCDEVTVANAEIAAKEAEIAELKERGAGAAEDEDVEVEVTEEPIDEPCCCDAPKDESCCCDEPADEPKDEPCCCDEPTDEGGEDKAE